MMFGFNYWKREAKRLQRELENTRMTLREVRADAYELRNAYATFKNEYDEYRKQFDPVEPVKPPLFEQVGNVVKITRFEKEKPNAE